MESARLYHIDLIRNFVEFIERNYPAVSISRILEEAQISRSEYEDDGYWFTQEQSDRFYLAVVNQVGRDIAREAGRYVFITPTGGTFRDFVAGFL